MLRRGELPEGVTPRDLVHGQISVLRNPDIAHVLYLQGMMEKLGRGGVLIDHACKAQGLPAPEWRSDASGVTLIFRTPEVIPEATPEVATEVTPEVLRLLRVVESKSSRRYLQQALNLKDSEHLRKAYLLPALTAGMIEMTVPDKPTSSKQRYRLRSQGRRLRTRIK